MARNDARFYAAVLRCCAAVHANLQRRLGRVRQRAARHQDTGAVFLRGARNVRVFVCLIGFRAQAVMQAAVGRDAQGGNAAVALELLDEHFPADEKGVRNVSDELVQLVKTLGKKKVKGLRRADFAPTRTLTRKQRTRARSYRALIVDQQRHEQAQHRRREEALRRVLVAEEDATANAGARVLRSRHRRRQVQGDGRASAQRRQARRCDVAPDACRERSADKVGHGQDALGDDDDDDDSE